MTERQGNRLVHLFSTDKQHLQDIADDIDLGKEPRWQSSLWALTTARKDLVEPLFDAGLTTQKSSNLGPLKVEDGFNDFLRGYCDGDGSIGLNYGRPTLSYSAKRREFLDWLRLEIQRRVPGSKMHASEKNSRGHIWYSLQGSGANIIPVLSFMYKGANLALKR